MKKTLFLASALGLLTFAQAQQVTASEFGQVITKSSQENLAKVFNEEEDENILWEQAVSTAVDKFSIVSTQYLQNGWGLYAADDFVAESKITINSILFYGSQSNDEAQEKIEKVNLYFYADDNGAPLGSPEIQGSEITKISFDYENIVVTPGEDAFMGNKVYYIDILENSGAGIELEAGHYWLSIVFDIDMDSSDFDDRFVWSDHDNSILNDPKLISTKLGFPQWATVSEVGFPVKSFAYTLYGDQEMLSTSSFDLEQLKVYPNPTTEVFYISGSKIEQVNSVRAINTLGQSFELNYQNGKVDVAHLNKGVYIIQIETSQGVVNRKIVKK